MKKNSQVDKSGSSVVRQYPFVIRRFEPLLNDKWIGEAVSYGCYRSGQAPGIKGPSVAEIEEDLQIILRHWNLIRLYSSDGDSARILEIIRKKHLPVKVMLGVWLENETGHPERREENIAQAIQGINLANEYTDLIAAVCVGNETQVTWSAHRMDQQDLIKYVRLVRNNTNAPVTTADDYSFWITFDSKKVADEIDFIVTHLYSMWNGITLENAIEWMDRIYFQEVRVMHPDKETVIGEAGWATNYNTRKTGPGEQASLIKGTVDMAAQEYYLIHLHNWITKTRVNTFLFEAFDEPWKGGGENSEPDEVEKHWGVFYESRQPKISFINYLRHHEHREDTTGPDSPETIR
ncbi:MAG: glycosyl hydrolase family 17 [Bacteroidales bacterium]|nr:glycosyl hydrolase family 17 [Bacteroidales bacterium]